MPSKKLFKEETKLVYRQEIKKKKKELTEARRTLRNMEKELANPSVPDIVKLNYRDLIPEQQAKIAKLEGQLEKLKYQLKCV